MTKAEIETMMAENAARGYGVDTSGVRYPVDRKGMMTGAEMERRLLAAGLGRVACQSPRLRPGASV
jgi:hypothetical protein